MTSNRVALITGASRGIGKAITLALAESGLDVVINFASQHEAAAQVQKEALQFGVRAELPAFGSPDLVALELYLADRARGLAVAPPGVRK